MNISLCVCVTCFNFNFFPPSGVCDSFMLVRHVSLPEAYRVARPPGPGTKQEVLLAAAVNTHLTRTIVSQFIQTAAVGKDFHIKDWLHSLGLENICT